MGENTYIYYNIFFLILVYNALNKILSPINFIIYEPQREKELILIHDLIVPYISLDIYCLKRMGVPLSIYVKANRGKIMVNGVPICNIRYIDDTMVITANPNKLQKL